MTEQKSDVNFKEAYVAFILFMAVMALFLAAYDYDIITHNSELLKGYSTECYKYNYDTVKANFQNLTGCMNQTPTQMTCYFLDNTTMIVPCVQQILIRNVTK